MTSQTPFVLLEMARLLELTLQKCPDCYDNANEAIRNKAYLDAYRVENMVLYKYLNLYIFLNACYELVLNFMQKQTSDTTKDYNKIKKVYMGSQIQGKFFF